MPSPRGPVRRSLLLTVLVALLLPTATACGPVDDAVTAIDNAMAEISKQSSAWQQTLQTLEGKLGDLESNADTQTGVLLNQTSNNVDAMLSDSIRFAGSELNRAVDHVADQARCQTSFFTDSINGELGLLKSHLLAWQKDHAAQQQLLPHRTCWVDPSVVYVYRDGSGWGVNTDNLRDAGHTVYIDGYGFRGGSGLPTVDLMNGGTLLQANAMTPRYVDGYQLALDLPSDLQQVPDGAALMLHWPDDPTGVDATTIGLQKLGRPKLAITQIDWHSDPAGNVIAGQSQVWPIVTVKNTGDGKSEPAGSLSWSSGDGWTSPVVTIPSLDPGQETSTPVPLAPHQYGNVGSYNAVVQLQGYQSDGHPVVVQHPPMPEKHFADFPASFTQKGKPPLQGGFGADVPYGGNCDPGYVRTANDLEVSAVTTWQGKAQATASIKWASEGDQHSCRVIVHYSIRATGGTSPNEITVLVDIRERGES